jgi:hypothetical protein
MHLRELCCREGKGMQLSHTASCPVMGSDVCGVKFSGSTTRELMSYPRTEDHFHFAYKIRSVILSPLYYRHKKWKQKREKIMCKTIVLMNLFPAQDDIATQWRAFSVTCCLELSESLLMCMLWCFFVTSSTSWLSSLALHHLGWVNMCMYFSSATYNIKLFIILVNHIFLIWNFLYILSIL